MGAPGAPSTSRGSDKNTFSGPSSSRTSRSRWEPGTRETRSSAAFGAGDTATPGQWREGVRWLPEATADLFAFTLDKTTNGFSPTTRYRDYAISQNLIHWESQNTTRVSSTTGQRYIHHEQTGTSIVLFARLRTNDRAFWCLGTATYVSHESERPISFTWRLHNPLPADLFQEFAAAVA